MKPTGSPPRRETQQHDLAAPPQLTKAPTTDSAHPAVVDRVTRDMRDTAVMLDSASGQSMAADDPWTALLQLRKSVEDLYIEASSHRPELALTYGLDLAGLPERSTEEPCGGDVPPNQTDGATRQASLS